MFEWISDPQIWASLLTLTLLWRCLRRNTQHSFYLSSVFAGLQ